MREKLIILGEGHRGLLENSSNTARTAWTKWEDVRDKSQDCSVFGLNSDLDKLLVQ